MEFDLKNEMGYIIEIPYQKNGDSFAHLNKSYIVQLKNKTGYKNIEVPLLFLFKKEDSHIHIFPSLNNQKSMEAFGKLGEDGSKYSVFMDVGHFEIHPEKHSIENLYKITGTIELIISDYERGISYRSDFEITELVELPVTSTILSKIVEGK